MERVLQPVILFRLLLLVVVSALLVSSYNNGAARIHNVNHSRHDRLSYLPLITRRGPSVRTDLALMRAAPAALVQEPLVSSIKVRTGLAGCMLLGLVIFLKL